MSWWSADITSLASAALKKAQTKIDKVLDIPPVEDDEPASATFNDSSLTASDKASSSRFKRPDSASKTKERKTPRRSAGLTLGAKRKTSSSGSPRLNQSSLDSPSRSTADKTADTSTEASHDSLTSAKTLTTHVTSSPKPDHSDESGYKSKTADCVDALQYEDDHSKHERESMTLFQGEIRGALDKKSSSELNIEPIAQKDLSKLDLLTLELNETTPLNGNTKQSDDGNLLQPEVNAESGSAVEIQEAVMGDLQSEPENLEERSTHPPIVDIGQSIIPSETEPTATDATLENQTNNDSNPEHYQMLLNKELATYQSVDDAPEQNDVENWIENSNNVAQKVEKTEKSSDETENRAIATKDSDSQPHVSEPEVTSLQTEPIPSEHTEPASETAKQTHERSTGKIITSDSTTNETLVDAAKTIEQSDDDLLQIVDDSVVMQSSSSNSTLVEQTTCEIVSKEEGLLMEVTSTLDNTDYQLLANQQVTQPETPPPSPTPANQSEDFTEEDPLSISPNQSGESSGSPPKSPPTNTDLIQSTCSDGSFVKCNKPLSWIDSTENLMQKAATEFSDLETGTSSDIEIISLASTYDTNGGDNSYNDFVPLSRSVFKTTLREISSESPTSPQPQSSPGSETGSESATKQAELDLTKVESVSVKTLLKKLAQLSERLDDREKKLMSTCSENAELIQVNDHLKQRIESMEEKNGALDGIKSEFGQRIQTYEQKLSNAIREKESVKKQLLHIQQELENRKGLSGKLQKIIEEKDEQISQLIEEGEKLSKQQLQSSNLIKKLRKKEKDNETSSQSLQEQVNTQKQEITTLSAQLAEKATQELKHLELIKQFQTSVTSYHTNIEQLKTELDEHSERAVRAESAVDKSYKEVTALHKQLAAKDSEINQLKASSEELYNDKMQSMLKSQEKEAMKETYHLTNQIEDMQFSLSKTEKDWNRREEMLKNEISDLIHKLELSESRNSQLGDSITSATKPLVRQIENLQSSLNMQMMNFERSEKQLMSRLSDTQNQLSACEEDLRQSKEASIQYTSRIKVMETQLQTTKQEKTTLQQELHKSQTQYNKTQEEFNRLKNTWSDLSREHERTLVEHKTKLGDAESSLSSEQAQLNSERNKNQTLSAQIINLEQQITESVSKDSVLSRSSSPASDALASSTPAKLQPQVLLSEVRRTARQNSSNIYDLTRLQGSTALLEGLESQIKLKDGEIFQLQNELIEHERTRESLTNEMLKLTNQNLSFEKRIIQLEKLQPTLNELNGRYDALLQMYGEKEEEVRELRLDLQDVKTMYKQQIDVLMSQ